MRDAAPAEIPAVGAPSGVHDGAAGTICLLPPRYSRRLQLSGSKEDGLLPTRPPRAPQAESELRESRLCRKRPLPSSQTPVWCAGRGPAPRPPSPATSGAARVASEIRVLACLPCQHTGQPAVWVTPQTLSPKHLPTNIWEREGDAPCSLQHPHF